MWSRSLEYAAWWLGLLLAVPVAALVLMSFGWLPGKWIYIFQAAFVGVGTVVLIVGAIWASRRRKARRGAESSRQ